MSARGVSTWVTVAAVILLSACTNPISDVPGDSDGADTTPPSADKPAAPGLLLPADGAADTGNLVTLEWEASTGATSYDVYLGTDSPPAVLASGGEEITATELAVSGLSYDTTYSWFVRAKNAEGSADSEVRSFSTGAAPTSPPGQTSDPTPANEAVGVAPDSGLQWAAAAGAESYDLYLGVGSLPGSATATGITATSYDPGALTLEAEYHWRVDAVNALGTTTGTEWTFTVADAASLAPNAPTNVNATVSASSGSDTIDLTWTDNSTDETGFEIERSDDGGTSWDEVTTTAANATSYSDSGLQPDATYRFRVRAVNDYAESSWDGNDVAATATTDVSPYVYVSWDGGDDTTGSGTASNPYAGVTKGLAEATAGQTIRVAGTTGSEVYREGRLDWKEDVDLEGGWAPGFSVHDPPTYVSVIREPVAAPPRRLVHLDEIAAAGFRDVTIANLPDADQAYAVTLVWSTASFERVILEADGALRSVALEIDAAGSTTTPVTVDDSTLRAYDSEDVGSSSWSFGLTTSRQQLSVTNTDVESGYAPLLTRARHRPRALHG